MISFLILVAVVVCIIESQHDTGNSEYSGISQHNTAPKLTVKFEMQVHSGAAGEPGNHAEYPAAASEVKKWSLLADASPMPEVIVQLVQRGTYGF